jgi:hypothetical protein
MGKAELEALLRRPDTLRQILGNYQGPFSIGVTEPQRTGGRYSITLLVSDEYRDMNKKFAVIENMRFPLIIKRDLQTLQLF